MDGGVRMGMMKALLWSIMEKQLVQLQGCTL
jgi:hypothetical protein